MAHSHTPTPVSLRTHVTNGYIDNDPVRVEIVAGGLDGDVIVINDEDNPVPTDETLFASFTVSRYTIDTSGAGTQTGDTAWQGADDIESRGFMLVAPLENTGTIWIGDSTSTCFIGLSPGSRTSYPLPNLTQVYAYATDTNDADQFLVVERYF